MENVSASVSTAFPRPGKCRRTRAQGNRKVASYSLPQIAARVLCCAPLEIRGFSRREAPSPFSPSLWFVYLVIYRFARSWDVEGRTAVPPLPDRVNILATHLASLPNLAPPPEKQHATARSVEIASFCRIYIVASLSSSVLPNYSATRR